ncbi:hypothetical protein SCLCIDRAFT_1213790 [Scleroderma citrinum Foug A]|uniref:Uncharacterized protein n=1 Tax=Scleroderma citrinum Foug A TaxID=1036808 RepID=A0A0C3DTM3_9AGAM|nr:hypothetical protein SCLCIDRAFT_1213790 [Scleroderma citrinum Foug A]
MGHHFSGEYAGSPDKFLHQRLTSTDKDYILLINLVTRDYCNYPARSSTVGPSSYDRRDSTVFYTH